MEPRMAKRGALRVVGVEDDAAKIDGEEPGFAKLWMGRFMSQSKEVEPYRTDEALNGWLPSSDFEQDTSKPRFDYHPPGTAGQDSAVSVWIPVKRK